MRLKIMEGKNTEKMISWKWILNKNLKYWILEKWIFSERDSQKS